MTDNLIIACIFFSLLNGTGIYLSIRHSAKAYGLVKDMIKTADLQHLANRMALNTNKTLTENNRILTDNCRSLIIQNDRLRQENTILKVQHEDKYHLPPIHLN